jgi:hypothetical protein
MKSLNIRQINNGFILTDENGERFSSSKDVLGMIANKFEEGTELIRALKSNKVTKVPYKESYVLATQLDLHTEYTECIRTLVIFPDDTIKVMGVTEFEHEFYNDLLVSKNVSPFDGLKGL